MDPSSFHDSLMGRVGAENFFHDTLHANAMIWLLSCSWSIVIKASESPRLRGAFEFCKAQVALFS